MDIQGSFFSPCGGDARRCGRTVGTYYLNIKNPADEAAGKTTPRRGRRAERESAPMATVYGADAGFIESGHSAAVAALEQMDSEAAQAVSTPASLSGLVRGNAAAQRQATTQPEKAGRSRKANRLLRKWAANAWVNIDLDTALAKTADPATRERTEAFVRFFDKWYNAGRNGMRSIDVILNADNMEFPPFLQEPFYRAGREETGALTKEKVINNGNTQVEEVPDGRGVLRTSGAGGQNAGGLLDGVPAQNVREDEGGALDRDAGRPVW